MYEWVAAEKIIHEAKQEIEKMPADVRLTNAIQLLTDAQNAVADFVDSEEGLKWKITTATPV